MTYSRRLRKRRARPSKASLIKFVPSHGPNAAGLGASPGIDIALAPHGWTNEETVVEYWSTMVERETVRHRQMAEAHRRRSSLYLVLLFVALVPPALLLASLTFTESDAIGLFLTFYSFALLYAGAEALLYAYRRKRRVEMSRLEELRLERYESSRRDVLRIAIYELALSGRVLVLFLGYQSGVSNSPLMAFTVVSGIVVMAALNAMLICDYLTGDRFVINLLRSMSERDAEKARNCCSLMYLALAGFSFVTVWQIGASFVIAFVALDIMIIFHSARGFMHHNGLRSEYEAMEGVTEDFVSWIDGERPSFDRAHAAYLRMQAGEEWRTARLNGNGSYL